MIMIDFQVVKQQKLNSWQETQSTKISKHWIVQLIMNLNWCSFWNV